MRIVLLQMPFAPINVTSIGLTQLRSILEREHGDRVSVEVHYLSHDFAVHLAKGIGLEAGLELYDRIHDFPTGLGEFFFRAAAFPSEADNSDQYFKRYYPGTAPATVAFVNQVMGKRREIDEFLDEMIDHYRLEEADIVGLTSAFHQNLACWALARKLKQRKPSITIVMGGANCENPMGEEMAKCIDALDYVFSGPSLKSFPQFVQYQLDGETEKCDSLPGVFCKTSAERPLAEQIGEELDINAELDLDYDSFFESLESNFPGHDLKPWVVFETSRGCWWGAKAHCKFCGLNPQTMYYRAMHPDKAISMFETLFERYASKSKYFFAADNIIPAEYPKEVFAKLDTPKDVTIYFTVKASLKEEDIEILAPAGVKDLQPGIESLATSSLKLMRKGTTSFTNLLLLMNCLKHDVHVRWNLLVGFPGEGVDVYEKYVSDLHRATHLCPPRGVAAIRYDRYSPYFNDANDYNLELRPLEYYEYIYPFDDASVVRMSYHFMDMNFDAEYIGAMAKWLGEVHGEVRKWTEAWDNAGEAGPPQLCLKTKGKLIVVHDSRSGRVVEHDVTGRRQLILEFLDKPMSVGAFENFAATENFDARAELAFLEEHQLVWRDGDRLMSLVIPLLRADRVAPATAVGAVTG